MLQLVHRSLDVTREAHRSRTRRRPRPRFRSNGATEGVGFYPRNPELSRLRGSTRLRSFNASISSRSRGTMADKTAR
jgi:hypothetical protein